MHLTYIIIGYFLILNLIGFSAMGIDKYKARHHHWRIPEKTLFLFSLLGGSVGTLIGMYFFRHKTQHWYFVIGMPLILILQIAGAICLLIFVLN